MLRICVSIYTRDFSIKCSAPRPSVSVLGILRESLCMHLISEAAGLYYKRSASGKKESILSAVAENVLKCPVGLSLYGSTRQCGFIR